MTRIFLEPKPGKRVALVSSGGMSREQPSPQAQDIDCIRYFPSQESAASYYKEAGWKEKS